MTMVIGEGSTTAIMSDEGVAAILAQAVEALKERCQRINLGYIDYLWSPCLILSLLVVMRLLRTATLHLL